MVISSSYKVKITSCLNENWGTVPLPKKVLRRTWQICSDALAFIIEVAEKEYDGWKDLKKEEQTNFFEKLIHHTSKNKNPKYENFDALFSKLPSGIRRSAIHEAVGIFESWKSNHDNWEKAKHKKGEPKLSYKHHWNPTIYRAQGTSDGGEAALFSDEPIFMLKVFINNDWNWIVLKLRKRDWEYVNRLQRTRTLKNPRFEEKFGKFYLTFVFEETTFLKTPDIEYTKVCAVDLGLTNDAVCSIIDSTGTVLDRKFISVSYEKDQLNHICNRIKGNQQNSMSVRSLWSFANNFNDVVTIKTVLSIIRFANKNKADVIVMENLNMSGRKPKYIGQKVALWRNKGIARKAEEIGHRFGMRFSTICPRGTSALAYDGSGKVKRGKEVSKDTPYDVCQFPTGKYYNCDLNASYNIGARYFVRALKNKFPALTLPKASEVTLSTLWELNKAVA
jgi:transposase